MRGTGRLLTTWLGLTLATFAWAADEGAKAIFDGKGTEGWMTNKGQPLPEANVQPDGLNPHKSGGYLVVCKTPVRDFVLDFHYKLSEGCNSGIFLRVGDLANPVMTGLEIALDDSSGTGLHAPGAFYDLVGIETNAQKPVGEWNHMTITAKGSRIASRLNDNDVSRIDLDQWLEPGKRPDGSSHKFKDVAIRELNRPGYLGFQDHGSDCWFKDVTLEVLD